MEPFWQGRSGELDVRRHGSGQRATTPREHQDVDRVHLARGYQGGRPSVRLPFLPDWIWVDDTVLTRLSLVNEVQSTVVGLEVLQAL